MAVLTRAGPWPTDAYAIRTPSGAVHERTWLARSVSLGGGRPDRRLGSHLPPRPVQLSEIPARLLNLSAAEDVVLFGLRAAAGGGEEPDQGRPAGLVVRCEANELARGYERLLGCRVEARDELAQEPPMELSVLLALGDAPSLEVVRVGQLEPLEERATEHRGELVQALETGPVQAKGGRLAHFERVHERAGRVEGDGVPIGADARLALVVERAKLAQAPAQGPAWVVRGLPEHAAEPLAQVGPPGHREVGQERAGLLRLRQGDRLAAAGDQERAEQAEARRRRSRHLREATTRTRH